MKIQIESLSTSGSGVEIEVVGNDLGRNVQLTKNGAGLPPSDVLVRENDIGGSLQVNDNIANITVQDNDINENLECFKNTSGTITSTGNTACRLALVIECYNKFVPM